MCTPCRASFYDVRPTHAMPNTIKLRSSDDETFEVDEDVALYVSIDATEDDDDDAHEFIHSFITTD